MRQQTQGSLWRPWVVMLGLATMAYLVTEAPWTELRPQEDAIVGRASVADGHTTENRGQRIQPHGIDAPESARLRRVEDKSVAPSTEVRPHEDSIIGRASVVDGDTIEIRGQRIRLHGIDAPESAQLCRVNGKSVRCGQQAALALADRIGQRNVRCVETDVDRYGRIVAVCYVGAEDLNAWMVKEGWALAYRRYSRDYVSAETEANRGSRGIWRGEFQAPWEWRAERR